MRFDTIAVSKNLANIVESKIPDTMPNMRTFASIKVIKDNWLSDNLIVGLYKGQIVGVWDLDKITND